MKSVRIRSYSGLHFNAFGLNNSEYGLFLRGVTTTVSTVQQHYGNFNFKPSFLLDLVLEHRISFTSQVNETSWNEYNGTISLPFELPFTFTLNYYNYLNLSLLFYYNTLTLRASMGYSPLFFYRNIL